MYIPSEKVDILEEKIKDYLLVPKAKNDKSKFLGELGYSMANWNELESDLRKLVAENETYIQRSTPFGDLYEVKGKLKNFGVVTIWLLMVGHDKFRFITLYPK